MLDRIFMEILDMSLQASAVILAVILIRLLLKSAPKIFSYALWSVVLLRLLCPISIEAPISLVPHMESVSADYTLQDQPISFFDAGMAAYEAVGDALNGGLGVQHIHTNEIGESGLPKTVTASWGEVWILFGQYVWLIGIAGLLLYSAATYLKLRKRLIGAAHLGENIYLADHIDSPFVLGVLRPKIYLPSALGEAERGYIIAHEQQHIQRLDHIVKLIAYVALALHWFNPLVWVSYYLFCKDMEMSCDESVIRKLGGDIRADYSASLLNLATGRRILAVTPLAFGEGDPKSRIKNLAKWKKPLPWVIAVSVLICLTAAGCLMTDRPAPAGITVEEKSSGENESELRLKVSVRKTDLSKPGKILADKIAADWAHYDSMSDLRKGFSSHIFGTVYIDTDTWYACEEAIGISVSNPLENVDWIKKTGYLGMESKDPDHPITHIKVDAYATDPDDRKLDHMGITSGYCVGDIRITLTAKVYAENTTFTFGSIAKGYATYTEEEAVTGSGKSVTVVAEDEENNLGYYNNDWYDQNAYWVDNNVFYQLRVIGNMEDSAKVQGILERLLGVF